MDHYTISLAVGVHGADYSITRHRHDPQLGIVRAGHSSGLLSMPLAGEPASAALAALAEELFNSASAPPWDVF